MNPTHHGRPSEAERAKALDAALAHLDKQYGVGTVMRLGDQARLQVEVIPTGSLALDQATGIGGYPQGRVVEIYGPESSGKTTLTLHAIASCQAKGGVAAFVDAEHALDPGYARRLGVDVESLLVSQPDNGEQALEIVEKLVSSGAIDLVVVDSVAALVPLAELEGEMGDTQVGLQARLMSKALRKITGVASRHEATVIFINQLRQKIGVMFGPSEVTTGGNALKFYASLRLDVRKIGTLTRSKEEEPYGNKTRVKVVKNKLAPPFRKVEFEIHFGKGISTEGELLNMALDRGFVRRNGSWFSMGDERLGQGLENARERLIAEPELRNRLSALVHGDSVAGPDVIDVEIEPAEAK